MLEKVRPPENSPSPLPSPPGRGRMIRAWLVETELGSQPRPFPSEAGKAIERVTDARSPHLMAAPRSPSPGGEGRGEGELLLVQPRYCSLPIPTDRITIRGDDASSRHFTGTVRFPDPPCCFAVVRIG